MQDRSNQHPAGAGAPEGGTGATVAELTALVSHLQGLLESERATLARELHNALGGLLTVAKMDVSWVRGRMSASADEAVRQKCEALAGTLDEALSMARQLVERLVPGLLEHFGLAVALRDHFEKVCASAGIRCTIRFDGDLEEMDAETALAMFRVTQEALAAIVASGGRTHGLELGVEGLEEGFVLRMQADQERSGDATPALPIPGPVIGCMRYRVLSLGGRFEFDDVARGTRLNALFPRQRLRVAEATAWAS